MHVIVVKYKSRLQGNMRQASGSANPPKLIYESSLILLLLANSSLHFSASAAPGESCGGSMGRCAAHRATTAKGNEPPAANCLVHAREGSPAAAKFGMIHMRHDCICVWERTKSIGHKIWESIM